MIDKDKIYVITIILILSLFLIRESCNKSNTDKLIADISEYKSEAEQYKTKLGLEVSTNKALVLETQSQIKSLLSSNDTLKEWISKFKKINAGIIVRETTIVKEVAVPFDKIIPCDFKPFPAIKKEKFFEFYSTISNTGLTIDSLKIPNESRIVVGERKDGFFKPKKLVVDVNNSNPYIQTSNISGFVYKPEKKWYERNLVIFAFGFAGGYFTNELINR
jgi:hypothetical protein